MSINETGTVNVSELIRNDLKKTIDNAKYPQKSEAGVLDSTEIVTKGLSEAIPYIVFFFPPFFLFFYVYYMRHFNIIVGLNNNFNK